jgi:hypothetical protein
MADNQTRTVKLSEAKKYAKHHFKHKRPFFLWGAPGIGKSDLIAGIVNEMKNSCLIDVRLPLWEPTDIKGIPYYNSVNNTMTWAAPSELPSKEFAAQYDTVVLFLDELNGAAPAVQAAAYQLILNRRVGTYELPSNVVIAAAGNRESDKGVSYRMPKPLANRFLHYEIRVDFQDWQNWAIGNGIHPDVVGYLTFSKGDLHKFDPSSTDRSFATPRSWSFVSELLDDCASFNPEEITDMVSGAVGEGVALKFNAHRAVSSLLPDPTLILKGKITDLKTREISAMYSLATSLSYELKTQYDVIGREIQQEDFNEMLDNMLGFCMKHFDPEMSIMSIRVLATQYNMKLPLRKLKNGMAFFEKYGDLVLAAA